MKTGIDAGGSSTKIVAVDGRKPVAAGIFPPYREFGIADALEKFISDNGIMAGDVEKTTLTGVGSLSAGESLCGIPASKTDEFQANAAGAGYYSDNDKFMVTSMGTGTSFVLVDGKIARHAGGLGIGGGTLAGLSRLLLGTDDISDVSDLAAAGLAGNTDILIKDLCDSALPGLPLYATASLFGKAAQGISDADTAAGLIRLVLQTIGSSAALCAAGYGITDLVLIGRLCTLPQCSGIFGEMEKIYGVRFIIPEHPGFCTALGAALSD